MCDPTLAGRLEMAGMRVPPSALERRQDSCTFASTKPFRSPLVRTELAAVPSRRGEGVGRTHQPCPSTFRVRGQPGQIPRDRDLAGPTTKTIRRGDWMV